MIKLIASDLDGTLLNSRGELQGEFYQVFEALKDKKILFAAASGRQYYTLLDMFEKIKDDILFIAENGTFVVYKGEELFAHTMDRNHIGDLIKIGRKIEGAYLVLCGKKGAYIESDDERFLKEVKKYYHKNQLVDDITQVEDEILKVTVFDFAGVEEHARHHYLDYNDLFQISVAGEHWLDMTAKGANKGLALRKVQELLHITYEETMVFGDYLNDLEMMEAAYHSYAMENAHEDLKKVSRFMAESNEVNGVLKKIKEVIQI